MPFNPDTILVDLVPTGATATPTTPAARTWRPRTFRTYYYNGIKDPLHKWARIGRACTRESAVRAAVVKVLLKQYEKVYVVNEEGINVAIMTRKRDKINVICV